MLVMQPPCKTPNVRSYLPNDTAHPCCVTLTNYLAWLRNYLAWLIYPNEQRAVSVARLWLLLVG
jgi:hypothetical protein